MIGEHVDYNDGLVLPFAIDRSVMVAFARRNDAEVRAYSGDYDEHSDFSLSGIPHEGSGAWGRYVRGIASAMVDGGLGPNGLELAIAGDVPQGAGLSSSAALEVAVAGAFRAAHGLPLDDVALARLCQRAENEFVGVQCGIMDQFAATLCRRDHALLIDCRTLAYEHVPLRFADAGMAIVVVDSGASRALASSAYNERRAECERAVRELRALLGRPELTSLRDVTSAEIDAAVGGDFPSMLLRRARHAVGEIGRVAEAAEGLAAADFERLGGLMAESHVSLRGDYEVSSAEVDLLVALASAQEYVLGARLTGAGFGGCTVNLVRADRVEQFERDVIAPYRERTGLAARAFVVTPSDGLRVWDAGG